MNSLTSLPWEDRAFLVKNSLYQECELRERDEIISPSDDERIDEVRKLPAEQQEEIIIQDVITALRGHEGSVIKARIDTNSAWHDLEFYVANPVLGNLKKSAENVLQLCSNRYLVQQFAVATHSYPRGRVSHAFGRQLLSVIQELDLVVTAVDKRVRVEQRFRLSEVNDLCQPFIGPFQTLASLVWKARKENLMGAPLLNLITKQMKSYPVDNVNMSRTILHSLWKASCQPYTEMLERWLYRGILDDPWDEFMVEKHEEMTTEDPLYWEKCYQIRPLYVPEFLQEKTIKILTAGKCFTIVRECDHTAQGGENQVPVTDGSEMRLPAVEDERSYLKRIDMAYKWSCDKLLHLIKDEYGLMARLLSIKHCFLLDQSDFILDFMDNAAKELGKFKEAASKRSLAPMLDHALRTSVCYGDPFHADITFTLDFDYISSQLKAAETLFPHGKEPTDDSRNAASSETDIVNAAKFDQTNKLEGWDVFTLDYKVPWPISLVVTEQSLVIYRLIFRHLFSCLSTKRLLERSHFGNSLDPNMRNWVCLGQRMLQLLRCIEYYSMHEVLEPNWREMETAIQTAKSVDEVIGHHNAFLQRCFKGCLLHHEPFSLKLRELRNTCLEYANTREGLDSDSRLLKLRHLEKAFGDIWLGLKVSLHAAKEPAYSSLLQSLRAIGQGLPAWMQDVDRTKI